MNGKNRGKKRLCLSGLVKFQIIDRSTQRYRDKKYHIGIYMSGWPAIAKCLLPGISFGLESISMIFF